MLWYGIRPRADWMDIGDFNDKVEFWTLNKTAAHSLARVFYGGMAEVVQQDAPDENPPS